MMSAESKEDFEPVEARWVLSNLIRNYVPSVIKSNLQDQPSELRDLALEIAMGLSEHRAVQPVYEAGVSEFGMMQGLRAGVETLSAPTFRGRLSAMRTVGALLDAADKQALPEEAPPVSRFLKRIGLHGTAMAVADLAGGFQAASGIKGAKPALGVLGLSAGGAALAANNVLTGAEISLSKAAIAATTVGLCAKSLFEAFGEGRTSRLRRTARDIYER